MASTVRIPAQGRPRRWPLIVVGAIVVLAIVFQFLSSFFIDLLWYREVDQSGVFWTALWTKLLLGLVAAALFFGLLYTNLLIARRLRPDIVPLTPDQEILERLRDQAGPTLRWLVPLGAAVLAILVGIAASGQWDTFLLWRNSGGITFGNPEPLFDRDPAFYVFDLPWLNYLQGWLFSALVGVTLLTAIAHVFWGGIRIGAPRWSERVIPRVWAHLSVLLALIMLVKAWGYYLGRFDLLGSPRGVVQGASYTDVNAQLPALNFLAIAAVVSAILFLINIRFRSWALPVIAIVILALTSILLGTVYPGVVQRFTVAPQELQREEPYIADNIEGTRHAFALDRIEFNADRKVDAAVLPDQLEANEATLSNIRLWRPAVLAENFRSLQRIRQYYEFNEVDVDRYTLSDGRKQVLMISGREIDQDGIPGGGGTWQNRHLVYTHGFGTVASRVNTASTEGAPIFTVRDIPPVGEPVADQPRIYYGEISRVPFVVVKTGTPELDYEGQSSEEQATTTYTGTGGIPMGNALQRALFAWRYRDVNLLISGLIDAESRIMIYRSLVERVPRPAPFLGFDADPYPAVVEGRIVWIWDAYTATDGYPYSQNVDLSEATQGDLAGTVNYLRNSVKVVVDAYTGRMTYYLMEDGDSGQPEPIALAWSRAFPDLFTPESEASEELRAHFRYPENLFQVQSTQFANYHVTDPSVFYQKQDFWQIPSDPTQAGGTDATGTAVAGPPMRPYYLLMKLPGEDRERFQLVLPFVPEGRQNMVAWIAADSEPDTYGRIVAYSFPSGRNVDGPQQVFARINQDAAFSAFRTLLGQQGSDIQFGDFLVIPIGDAFLYVQPVYVRADQEGAIPELKRVIAVTGGTVGLGDTLDEAIGQAVGAQVPDGGGDGGDGGGDGGAGGGQTTEDQIAELLAEAVRHFQAADVALQAGDLGTYQRELEQAQSLVEEADQLAAQSESASASPSPSASPTPAG
jgi:hypothetical protein